ncbi:hypothetical protein ACWD25_56910 [Streptomyces sp. NPDC002920]
MTVVVGLIAPADAGAVPAVASARIPGAWAHRPVFRARGGPTAAARCPADAQRPAPAAPDASPRPSGRPR